MKILAARLTRNLAAIIGACWLTHTSPATAKVATGQSDQKIVLQLSPLDAQSLPPVPTAGLQAWAKTATGWSEVPVQLDERDANGDYVLEHGIPFTAQGGDGVFNGNDELVIALPATSGFFSSDEARKQLKPTTSNAVGRILKGWIVDLESSSGPNIRRRFRLLLTNTPLRRKTLKPAVSFDPATNTVLTPSYRYTFHTGNPAAVGQLVLAREKDSAERPEISLETINQGGGFAVWLRPPWGFPVVQKSDSDLSGAVESWRTGPIRAIVAVGSKYSALWSTIKTHLFSELVFYQDRFQIPSVIDITFSPDRFLGKGSGFAYGMKLANLGVPKIERNGDDIGSVTARHQSGLVLRARVDAALASAGTMPAVWIDPPGAASGTDSLTKEDQGVPASVVEWFRQTSANIGFFVDVSRMKKGRYDFSLDLESQGEANLPHTDFLICKSVWTPLEPSKSTKTVAPVPKQESNAQH